MNKKELKSEKTKEDLRKAFVELYKTKPIEKISIKEITNRAGYNRATFYLYYKDIYHLLETIEDKFIQMIKLNMKNLAKAIDGEDDAIILFVKVLNEFYQHNKDFFTILINGSNRIVSIYKETIKEEMRNNIKHEKAREKNPTFDLILEYQLSAAIGVFSAWVNKYEDLEFEEILKLMYELSRTGFLKSVHRYLAGEEGPVLP